MTVTNIHAFTAETDKSVVTNKPCGTLSPSVTTRDKFEINVLHIPVTIETVLGVLDI